MNRKPFFIQAILLLKTTSKVCCVPDSEMRYDDYVQVHSNAFDSRRLSRRCRTARRCFPWAPRILRRFERDLQSAVNDTSVTLPFWDWSMEGSSNPFTPGFLGGDGDSAQAQRVTSGPFAYQDGRFEIRGGSGGG